ncbi:hypothetical protein A5661_16085 [Mycobacterium asiaticum]|nr:hypothetical protein A5661_16085 [Mycobacterium asiaticum]
MGVEWWSGRGGIAVYLAAVGFRRPVAMNETTMYLRSGWLGCQERQRPLGGMVRRVGSTWGAEGAQVTSLEALVALV